MMTTAKETLLQAKVLNINEISNILPHEYPFLLVDRVSIMMDKAIGIKNVTINEPFFSGHFPKIQSCLAFSLWNRWHKLQQFSH